MDKSPENRGLERAACPECLGIPSQAILDFLNECEKEDVELHSFMLLRHGKVAAEGWWKPFNAIIPHTMFSFSKSVTATAIGFAIDEGLVGLDTNVYSLFPEYAPVIKKRFENMLTVEHLLTMTSGKMMSFLLNTEKVDWVQSYLRAPFKHKPGEKFEYVTENSFMLAAIIKKVTGLCVVDYLNPRLFKPLGIEKPLWETNKSGIEAGGWGLFLKTEDQAKFVQCYLDNGKWNGRQIIPEFWAKTAGERHVEKTPGVSPDHAAGYGYHFWRNSMPDSYRCAGVFSQQGVVMKEWDACFVTTAGEPLEDKVLEIFWKYFPKYFSTEPLPDNPEALANLRKKTGALSMPCLPKLPRSEKTERRISGRLIKFRLSRRATVLGAAANAVSTKKSGGFNNVRLTFTKDCLKLSWTEKYDENTVDVGCAGEHLFSKARLAGITYDFASCCAWLNDDTLEIWLRPLQATQVRKLTFSFDGENVNVKSVAEKGLDELALFGLDFLGVKTDDLVLRLAGGAAKVIEPIVEPDLRGKFFERYSNKKPGKTKVYFNKRWP